MKSTSSPKSKTGDTREVTLVNLTRKDRDAIKEIARRYDVKDLVDFCEGIVIHEETKKARKQGIVTLRRQYE